MAKLFSGTAKLASAAAAVALMSAAAWWYVHRQSKAVAYVTLSASRGEVAPHVTASGNINPVVTIQVGTYVSGVIKELHCDFNTQVKKGQLCAKIDPLPYQTVVDQAKANLLSAQAQLVKDQANLDYTELARKRYRELLASDSIPQDTYDVANNAFQQALAQISLDVATIKQHAALLNAAQVNLNYTDIVSPVDGTVVSRNVTQGQTVAASFQTPTLYVIATDLTHMQVDTNISESDIGSLRVGNDATFTVEAYPDQLFAGRVTQIRQSPQTVQNVVTYDVVINAGNPELLLMPGMTAATKIVKQRKDNVLRVPNQALRYVPTKGNDQTAKSASDLTTSSQDNNQLKATLWLLKDNKPMALTVTTGLADDAFTEIVDGDLHVGDSLIVSERAQSDATLLHTPGQPTVRMPRL